MDKLVHLEHVVLLSVLIKLCKPMKLLVILNVECMINKWTQLSIY
jgi:hypothetical protein